MGYMQQATIIEFKDILQPALWLPALMNLCKYLGRASLGKNKTCLIIY